MGALFPRVGGNGALLAQAALAGAGLGVLGLAGGSLFLEGARGVLAATAGFVVTLLTGLAVGIWVGASASADAEIPLRGRWFAAGIGMGLAGAFASLWVVYEGLRGATTGRILGFLLIAAPAYLLGLLLPALLTWAERRAEEIEVDEPEAEERGGGWEPLGTLVLATLGGMAGGALLAGLVLPRLGAGPLLLGMAAALIVPTLFPDDAAERTEHRVLFETESPLSVIRVVEICFPGRRQPERRLYVNDEEESAELVRSGVPTLAYVSAAEQWLARVSARGDRYLFLGGGAYTLPRRVAERDPGARITVVELDPEVTRAAYQFFGLRAEHRVVALHGDARATIESMKGREGEFDRVFLDVYDGQERLPFSLITREAFAMLSCLLTPTGSLALNAIGVVRGPGDRRFWSIVQTLGDVFPAVALYTHLGRDFPERQNVLLAAAPEPGAVFPAQAGLFERWPREEWPQVEGTTIFRDVGARPVSGVEATTREVRGGHAAATS